MASTLRSSPPLVLDTTHTAAGAGATVTTDYTALRPFVVTDFTALALATVANSTAQLSRQALGTGSFNTVSNTVAVATISLLGRTTTLTVAQYVVAVTDVLRVSVVDGGAGGALARTFSYLLPTAISGAS